MTAPGLTLPLAIGTAPPPNVDRAITGGPTCLTCDPLPIDSDDQLQKKFQCFDDNLGAATGDLRASLIARMKLLFQLSGEHLTAAQRARVDALYDANPGASTFCSVAIPWESTCQTAAADLGLPGPLQLCQDLAKNANTSVGIAALETQHCLDQLPKTAQLSPDTCRLPTRDVADDGAEAVLSRSYPALTGDLATALPAVLTRIGAWWTAATTASAGDRAWLLGHSNALLRQLWTNIESAKVPLPTGALGNDSAAAALLADITETGFSDDFGVLSALYAPSQPAATPAVMTLTGDALQPLADRLARLETLHDVGCRFAECKPDGSALRSSATSELVHALAVLPDKSLLTTVLASATHLAQQQPALYAALSRMRDQHAYLETAWAALGRPEPFAKLATIVEPPAEVAALAAIVRVATIAWGSYQDSGEFVPWHRPRLTTAALQQAQLITFVDTLIGSVTQSRAQFEAARLATVNDVLAQSRQQGLIQSAIDRATSLRNQSADLVERSLGLEQREAQERAGIAGYQLAFEALVSSHALDSNATFQTETLTPFTASAADARFPGGASGRNVTRDRFAVVSMHSGESLRLHVGNKWTPTCALKSATLRNDNGDSVPIANPEAETGPEGYWVSMSNGSFTSHSTTNSHDTRKDLGTSIKLCYASPQAAELVTGLSLVACAHADYDQLWNDSTADGGGVDARTSASFSSGLRLSSTPFPEAPAGSLVAVLTPTGHPDQILDLRVVQRDDLIVAPALADTLGDQVDVHFAVNDLGGCSSDTTNKLQIDGVKTIPLGNVAKAMGAAMSATLTSIEAQAPAILAQGQLTGDEANAIRSNAWVTVQQKLPAGTALAGVPYDLRQLFDGFLEREIASIGRRGVMHGLAREQRQIDLAATALGNELAFADAQNRLLMLVPRWRLRDLSGTQLAEATDALSEALTAFVAQVYELRDPAAFSQFRSNVNAQLGPLVDLNVTGRFEDSVTTLTSFATAARNAMAASQFDPPVSERLNLVVAVPRTPKLCGSVACDWGAFRSVSSTAARGFWATVANSPSSTALTISPADLYSISGGASQLSCNEVAPIVRRAAIYLDTGENADIDLSSIGEHVIGHAGTPSSTVSFPLVGKTLALDVEDPAGVTLSLPVANGDLTTVLAKFGPSQTDLATGAGISPFTSFRFDMSSFQTGDPHKALTETGAALFVFEVERRLTSGTAQVPGVCP